MKQILISGYFGFDNSGDDAILKAIVNDFKQLNKDLVLTALSKNPRKTRWQYGIASVDRFSIREVIRTLRHTDLLLSGGGSLLQDITSTRSIIYYLSVILLAKILGVKVYVYANGVGPIDKKFNRILTRWVLSKADYITLRDDLSFQFVREELKVKNSKIEVTADPVFSLEPIDQKETETIFHLEKLDHLKDKKTIGLCIRDWKEASLLEEKLSKTIDALTEEGYEILMVPLHYPRDLDFSKKVTKSCQRQDQIHYIEHSYKAEQLMGIFNRLEMVLAMRLHSLVYASNVACPIVGLIYDPKVEGLLKELHIENYVHVEDFNVDELLEGMEETLDHASEKQRHLQIHTLTMKERALRNVEIALSLLED